MIRTLLFVLFFTVSGVNSSENNGLILEGTEGPIWNSSSDRSEADSEAHESDPITVVIFGDSITAGFGLDQEQAFPALIQKKADSLQVPIEVVNAGLSGETSAGGRARIGWILKRPIDIFVLELGGNDALRGVSPDATYENLKSIIEQVKQTSPGTLILLTGMEAPPNMGPDYTFQFRNIYIRIAEETGVSLMPFILDEVGGIPELNQTDGIHPTEEGHAIIAENLWPYLKPLIQKKME
jgi:acyl-CoA thioesterase-1